MDCDLCQIVSGARRADIFHETHATIAFLDRDPSARGHALLMPRPHVASLLHLSDGAAGSFFAALVDVMELLTEALHPARLEVTWTQGATHDPCAAHVHVRLVPAFRDDFARAQALGDGASRVRVADLAARVRRGRLDARRGEVSRLVPRRMAALGAKGGDGGGR